MCYIFYHWENTCSQFEHICIENEEKVVPVLLRDLEKQSFYLY